MVRMQTVMALGAALLVLMLSLLVVSTCFANGTFTQAKITRISAHDYNEVVLIFLDGNVANEPGCNTLNAVAINKSDVRFRELFVLATTAFYTNKTVYGWTHECYRNDGSGLGMPYVTRLDVLQ